MRLIRQEWADVAAPTSQHSGFASAQINAEEVRQYESHRHYHGPASTSAYNFLSASDRYIVDNLRRGRPDYTGNATRELRDLAMEMGPKRRG